VSNNHWQQHGWQKRKAQGFMSDAQFQRLPRLVSALARAGWFQGTVHPMWLWEDFHGYLTNANIGSSWVAGSVFFLIAGEACRFLFASTF
jgi:hypothetical protein